MTTIAALSEFPALPATVGRPTAATRCVTTLDALERELNDGLLESWRRLVDEDPVASLFQSPGWCVPWYRVYHDAFDPFLVIVTLENRLVGIVPLSVHRASGEISFASGTMADYRDIVAAPGYRPLVVSELLRAYLKRPFPNPLQIGWIDPTSDTTTLVGEECNALGLKFTSWQQPCYRWFPPAPAKPSAQKFLNWYKRQGEVTFELVKSEADWQRFRDRYYKNHSLRQIQAGRDTSFDDRRHREFYEALFHSPGVQPHVTAFRVNGEMLAGHYGYVWRGVLLLGPPAIRLEDEQRSPAIILLSWIIQNAGALGLSGFDLTLGNSDFKKRLGNQCVPLTTIEVYNRRSRYHRQVIRTRAVSVAKAAVAKIAPDGWEKAIKPAGAWLSYKRARLAEMGIAAAVRSAVTGLRAAVYERREGRTYLMRPSELRTVLPRLEPGETFEVHDNCVDDLLLWSGSSASTGTAITTCARTFARALNARRTMHTIVVNGKLAGWGYSHYPTEPAQLTETPGATLEFQPGSVALYDYHVLPEFRGRRVYQALISQILQQRFAEGATGAYITVLASNTPSRLAIERVGFRLLATHVYTRFLKWGRLAPRQTALTA